MGNSVHVLSELVGTVHGQERHQDVVGIRLVCGQYIKSVVYVQMCIQT